METKSIEYTAQERRRNRRTNRFISLIAVLVIGIYVASAPFYLDASGLRIVLSSAEIFVLLAAAYYVAAGSGYYLRHGWVDGIFFLSAFVLQTIITLPYARAMAEYGLSWPALLIVNTSILAFAAAATIAAAPTVTSITLAAMFALGAALLAQEASSVRVFLAYVMPLATATVVSVFACFTVDISRRRAFDAMIGVSNSKKRSEQLLYSVLPKDVAERLRNDATIADAYSEVSVIFVDIVGFTEMTRARGAKHLFDILNSFFLIADECAQANDVERVKTIGDAYLAVSGARVDVENCAIAAIRFGSAIIAELQRRSDMPWESLQVRVGIHTGAVVGGVIGNVSPHYDYWGDTVNVASRLQQHAEPGEILVSEPTYHRARREFDFAKPTIEAMKGVGEIKVYKVAAL